MYCQDHQREIEFVCKSEGYSFTMLCAECRKNYLMSKKDRATHLSDIVSIRKAFEEAEANLHRHKNTLEKIIQPFENEMKILKKIEFQKNKLNQEREEILRQVNKVFDNQIKQLEMTNKQVLIKNRQGVPLEDIHHKIKKIVDLESQYKKSPNKLKESLNYTEEPFINNLRKNNSAITSMDLYSSAEYFTYDDDMKHDFFISKLELKKRNLGSKPLKKVHNESELYFLIDRATDTKFLHYFSQNSVRVYNIENQKWKAFSYNKELPTYGCSIYDPKRERFYLIGGQTYSNKSNQIFWYNRQEGWGSAELAIPRSSAMATLVDSGKPTHNMILIGGGIGNNKKPLKSCELFDPQNSISYEIPSMNFGVSSGTMVTFNNSTVFKFGGLAQYDQKYSSICEIIEKFDYGAFSSGSAQKWGYIELEVISSKMEKFKLFYANQAAIQINPNEIFVFGGWSHDNLGVRESYIIEVDTIKNNRGKVSSRYYVRWINQKPLVSGQGFADLRPIICNRKIMSLQNISHGENQVLEKEKKLIQFDMYQWQETENIVNF